MGRVAVDFGVGQGTKRSAGMRSRMSEIAGRDVSPKRPTYFGGGRSMGKRNSTDGLESRPYLKAKCQVGTFLQNVRLILARVAQWENAIRRTAWRAVPT